MGLFAALGIETVAVRRLQRAPTVDEARTWSGALREGGRVGLIAMVTLLIAGVWMMAIRWGPEPWVVVSLAGVGLMAILGGTLTRRAMRRLGSSPAEGSVRLPTAVQTIIGRSLVVSLWLRVAIAVGILGLMTVKPEAPGSLAILGAAVVVGLGVGIRRRRPEAASTGQGWWCSQTSGPVPERRNSRSSRDSGSGFPPRSRFHEAA